MRSSNAKAKPFCFAPLPKLCQLLLAAILDERAVTLSTYAQKHHAITLCLARFMTPSVAQLRIVLDHMYAGPAVVATFNHTQSARTTVLRLESMT